MKKIKLTEQQRLTLEMIAMMEKDTGKTLTIDQRKRVRKHVRQQLKALNGKS